MKISHWCLSDDKERRRGKDDDGLRLDRYSTSQN